MKKLFTFILVLSYIGMSLGQSFTNKSSRLILKSDHTKMAAKGILDIEGTIVSDNYYIPGTTMDLMFTIDYNTPDEEFMDKLSITFPEGITPISGTDPFPGGFPQAPAETLNAINGQTISWGDNDNNFGGVAPGVYSFVVNAKIDSLLTGDQTFTYVISGDEYQQANPKDYTGNGILVQIPATAELVVTPIGIGAEYFEIPLEQATFTPKANVVNRASNLEVNPNITLMVSNGYSSTDTVPNMITNQSENFTFTEFTADTSGTYTFTYSTNFVDDANPENSTFVKEIKFNNTLRRDNGDVVGHIGIGNPGGELGNIFNVSSKDTITSVTFQIRNTNNIGDEISIKIRETQDGTPGNEIGHSLPITISEDSIITASIFPPLVVDEGSYYVGLVEGDNNIQLATTSNSFKPHSAWAFFNDQWNDLGQIGLGDTYYLRVHFEDVVFVNNDVALESLNISPKQKEGDIKIDGTVRNFSNTTNLTEFNLVYTIDNGTEVTDHITGLSLAPGETYDFSHSTLYSATSGIHSLTVTVSSPNGNADENEENNTLSEDLFVVNEIFPKVVVGEEATGTWCGWCVRGHVGLKDMAHAHDETEWIGIAVHNNDPMANPEYDAHISSMVGGYPSGVINRSEEVDPGLFEEQGFQARQSEIPLAKVEVTSAVMNNSRNVKIDVNTIFALNLENANYNLSMIYVEDSITGTSSGYNQVNYYSSQGITINDWEGIDWSTLGNPIPAKDMIYNHVGRIIIGGWDGIDNSVPSKVTYNDTNSYTFDTSMPEDYDENNVKAVIILIDNRTGEIENAVVAHIQLPVATTEIGDAELINIYPNPTSGWITIKAFKGSDILVHDMLGKTIISAKLNSEMGKINLGKLDNGTYSIEIINNNTIYSQKVILVK